MGLDYGAIQDTTCVTLFFPKPKIQGIIFDNSTIVQYTWIPEAGIQEKERKWGVPLQSWARAGHIFLQEGDMCDPLVIKDAMKDLILNGPGKCMGVGYDPWQSRVAMELLAAEIPHCEIKEVAQKWSNLTIPCKELKKHIWNGTLWHLNDPVSRWFFGNVLLEEAPGSGGMIPRKVSSDEKIDGVSSAVTAWAKYMDSPNKVECVYNTRGIQFI
jgi:phage terminase large subunit-like protein